MQTGQRRTGTQHEYRAAYVLIGRLSLIEDTRCALLDVLYLSYRPEPKLLHNLALLLAEYRTQLLNSLWAVQPATQDCWNVAYVEPLRVQTQTTADSIQHTLAELAAIPPSVSAGVLSLCANWLVEYHRLVAQTGTRYCPVTDTERQRHTSRTAHLERALVFAGIYRGHIQS